jgi:hypothetical protein
MILETNRGINPMIHEIRIGIINKDQNRIPVGAALLIPIK